MIINSTSLSMAESKEYFENDKENTADINSFVKKFVKMDYKKAKEMRVKIEALDLLKIKPTHISKIIDIMPMSHEEINKIFVDMGLNEEEINKVLEITKEFE